MKIFQKFKWFVGGFAIIALLFIFLYLPSWGQAQEPQGNLMENTAVQDNTNQQTDNPTGENFIPISDENLPETNYFITENTAVDSNSNHQTDNPTGQNFIALTDENLPETNYLEKFLDTGSTVDIQATSAANIQRENEILKVQRYVSPLVISAADFGADGSNPDSFFFPFSGGYIQGGSENYGCMVAPAYLPANVTVQEMFVTTYDNDTTYNINTALRRVDNFSGGTVTMAEASTTGDFTSIQVVSDATIMEPVVVYPDYSYYITTCVLSANIRLYSVRLYYAEP